MIGRTNTGGGGSSGGSALVVVGGTIRPAKAAQNMIWANTDKEITSYILSAAEPENPVNGMLWLTIADSGGIKIASPIGDDWLTVYPLDTKQYVSGAWVVVEAMSYQDGAWVEWFNPNALYEKGRINYELGGGLEVYRTVGDSSVTFGDSSFSVYVDKTTQSAIVGTKEKIDLSKYSKMYIVIDSASTDGEMFMAVRNDKQNTSWSDIHNGSLAIVKPKTAGTYDLPVSNCGTAYVMFGGVETYPQKMVVSKWYFK